MSLVVFEKVSLAFGGRNIVDNLDLRLGEGERVGLIGPNGAGKTTLLRLIADEQQPDVGEVRRGRHVRIGYLPQDITVTGEQPLLDFVLQSVPEKAGLEASIRETERALAQLTAKDGTNEEMVALSARLSELHEQRSDMDRLYAPHEAMRILMGLGFQAQDRDRSLAELSGGWKMRALLASLLFQHPDLLLLDEPTNHLDMPSVAWLSGFLERYRGAFVLISHDREFLNEQVDQIVTFETEGVRCYRGNYESYLIQREEEEVILVNQAQNIAREREKMERFIDRFRAKASKAKSVQSKVKALDRLDPNGSAEQLALVGKKQKTARFKFPPTERSGAEVLRAENLGQRYGEHEVFSNINLEVQRGERIGIIGVNGAGKTTLLRIMAGELEPSSGEVQRGTRVHLGYYAQHHAEMLDPKRTILEQVSGHCPKSLPSRVRTLLGALLFSGDDVNKKISVLSGGERARVALAQLLVDPGNVILMDEPTNHLDLDSSEALAEALASFDGTLVFVSHNRSFVRRLASKIWNVENGCVETYPGTLDEYMHHCRQRLEASSPKEVEASISPSTSSVAGRGTRIEQKTRKRLEAQWRAERHRRIGPLENEITQLEEKITELETRQSEAQTELEDPEIYQNHEKCSALLTEIKELTDGLDHLTTRWAEMQEEVETIEAELKNLKPS